MRLFKIIVFLIVSNFECLFGQFDSLVIYDSYSYLKKDTIVQYDTSVICKYLPSGTGSWGNKVNLDLELPDSLSKIFSHNRLVKNDFNTLFYPIRVNVAILRDRYTTNTWAQGSGILVSPNAVLTAGHIIGYDATSDTYGEYFRWKDSIVVSPSHENGNPQTEIGTIKAKKCYVFKKFVKELGLDAFDDLGLIILDQPIGFEIGWMGLGWVANDSFLTNNLFYNFSYPGRDGYDGFNMYYKYGEFEFSNLYSASASTNIEGIPGESGSGFFHTDNDNYTVYGIRTYAGSYTLITKTKFRILKALIDLYNPTSQVITAQSLVKLFPNPAHDYVIIEGLSGQDLSEISIYNSFGQLILNEQQVINNNMILIDIRKLKNGFYLLVFIDGKEKITRKIIKN